MPGFDGTGPRGRGPMTGGGEGFCVLKLSDAPHGSPAGAIDRASPVDKADGRELDLTHLQWEVYRIEASLNAIRARLEHLESTSTQHAGAGR